MLTNSCASPPAPSMIYLLRKGEWATLRKLIHTGVYDEAMSDNAQMSTIIVFAVSLHVPSDILHILCRINPEALTVGELPFRLARQNGSSVHSTIVLEAARQQALVEHFNACV